jgi:hypothetical protein
MQINLELLRVIKTKVIVKRAYDLLKEGGSIDMPIGERVIVNISYL